MLQKQLNFSSLEEQHEAEIKKMTATVKEKARQQKETEDIGPAYLSGMI